jgi:hypothetical protein
LPADRLGVELLASVAVGSTSDRRHLAFLPRL